MTKKIRKHTAVAVPIPPIVNEGPFRHDPLNVRIVKRELHRLEHRIIEEKGEASAIRRMMVDSAAEEIWEVPG